MFKQTLSIFTLMTLVSVGGMARAGHSTHGHGGVSSSQVRSTSTTITQTLSTAQAEGLIFMAEEEKIARDVYTHLAKTWGARVFTNIIPSEQRHMDSIEGLLVQHDLPVPSTMDQEGVFENEELQSLYDTLIAMGDSSLSDAFEVGVMIEEKDIEDLSALLQDSEISSDVARVYNQLLSASYNHLDAFNRELAQ